MGQAKLNRGERKYKTLKAAEFHEDTNTIDWINTMSTWKSDIDYYLDSIKPIVVEKPINKNKEVK